MKSGLNWVVIREANRWRQTFKFVTAQTQIPPQILVSLLFSRHQIARQTCTQAWTAIDHKWRSYGGFPGGNHWVDPTNIHCMDTFKIMYRNLAGETFKLRIFLSGDLEFLYQMYGLSGASGMVTTHKNQYTTYSTMVTLFQDVTAVYAAWSPVTSW